jgi:hypothetical protein
MLRVLIEVVRSNTTLFTWVAIDRDETVTGELESAPLDDILPFSMQE